MHLVQVGQGVRWVGFADDHAFHVAAPQGLEQRHRVVSGVGRNAPFRHVPQLFHFGAVFGVGNGPARRKQMRQRTRIAHPAAGVGLTSQGKRRCARAAYLPCEQMQVMDQIIGEHPLHPLVDAHAPQGHGGRRLGKCACGGVYLLHGNAADFSHLFRPVVFQKSLVALKIRRLALRIHKIYVPLPKTRVVQLFINDDPCHAVHEGQVGAGAKGHVHVGDARGVGAARVGHNDFHAGFHLLPACDAPEQHRVRLGGVGADNEKTGGLVYVGIGAHGLVLAEGGGVAAHRRGHAQPGVAVHIIGAETSLEYLVGEIAFFGKALARPIPCNGIGAIGVYAFAKPRGHEIKGFIPAYGFKRSPFLAAHHGLGHPFF